MTQTNPTLSDFEQHTEFVSRHIGPTAENQQHMLEQLGLDSMEALVKQVVPAAILSQQPLALGLSCTEQSALDTLATMAAKNNLHKSFIGQGYYNTYTPNVILRNLL